VRGCVRFFCGRIRWQLHNSPAARSTALMRFSVLVFCGHSYGWRRCNRGSGCTTVTQISRERSADDACDRRAHCLGGLGERRCEPPVPVAPEVESNPDFPVVVHQSARWGTPSHQLTAITACRPPRCCQIRPSSLRTGRIRARSRAARPRATDRPGRRRRVPRAATRPRRLPTTAPGNSPR